MTKLECSKPQNSLRMGVLTARLCIGIVSCVVSLLAINCFAQQAQEPMNKFAVQSDSAKPRDVVPMNGLHVVNNQILNGAGQALFFHGVNRSQTEYECIAGTDVTPRTQAIVDAIKSWNANSVRVPLNEDCWLGINTTSTNAAYMGAAYQQAIIDWVNLLTSCSNNLAVILDLHFNAPGTTPSTRQNPMPDADHAVAFWTSVASTFKSNSSVIFDLFNEPYPYFNAENQWSNGSSSTAWQCWLNGGNSCADPNMTYTAAGMQSLVDAVRSVGANNVIMVGGLQYSNDLTQWLTYEPADSRQNLMASWHVYRVNSCVSLTCWNSKVAPVAAQVPLIAGEYGIAQTDGTDCNVAFLDSLWSFLEGQQQGYAAWKFNIWPGECGNSTSFNWALISDETGTPTTYGSLYKNHIQSLPSTY